jgi:hypothetical protein
MARATPGGYATREEHLAALREKPYQSFLSGTVEVSSQQQLQEAEQGALEQWRQYDETLKYDEQVAEGNRRVQLWNDYYAQTGDYTPVVREPVQAATGPATTAEQKDRLRVASSLDARRGRTRTVLAGGYRTPELSAASNRPTLLGGG